MPYPDWPLFDLRLCTAGMVLRPMTDADLPTVADLMPADLELDPAATTSAGLTTDANRRVFLHQSYWRAYGMWAPTSWRLPFVLVVDGAIAGLQELEGQDFPTLRTVDSFSWLVVNMRGRGLGKQMRRAVLALALRPLAAEAAITSAWHDNHASLGVSRALGYGPNGESLHRRGDAVDVMTHLRLRRADWPGPGDVKIEGFEACRALFGS